MIFVLRDDNNLQNVKRGLFNALKELDLTKPKQIAITDYKEKRTNEQRGGFHLLCKLLGDALGYSQDDIKQYAKEEALGVHTVVIAGVSKEVVKPSEEAKRDEYSALIDCVYRLASQAGVILPILRR